MKADLVDHRKFLRLKRLLGEPTPHVIGYLALMWRRAYQTGNPLLGDELDVEAAAEYLGEPRRFATAALQSGFLDRTSDGQFTIHDLWDHAPAWAKKRMTRNGHAPPGVDEYAGVKTRKCRTAPKTPNSMPNGTTEAPEVSNRHAEKREERIESENHLAGDPASSPDPAPPVAPKARKPRARDELFDAIVAVTGADASVNGSFIGRLRKILAAAEPPYQPAEVLRMSERDFQSRELPWKRGEKLTLGELEKYIGRVRNPSPASGPVPRPKDRIDAEAEQFASYASDAFGGRP